MEEREAGRSGEPVSRLARRGLLGALLGMGLLLLLSSAALKLLRGEGVEALLRLWSGADPWLLSAGTLLLFGGIVFLGFRWKALLPGGERTSGLGLAAIAASALLLDIALPGPVGELLAVALVQRRYRIPAPTALAASLHGRLIGLGVAALLAAALWFLYPLPVTPEARAYVAGASLAVGVGVLGLGIFALFPHRLGRLLDRLLSPLARGEGRLARAVLRLGAWVRDFVEALGVLGRPGLRHLRAGGWSLLGIFSVVAGIWLASLALGHPASPAGLLFAHCAITAGALVLFALPVGQLGWDAAFAALLATTAGLPVEHALALAVLVRFQQLLVLLFGAGYLLRSVRWLGDEELALEGLYKGRGIE